MAELLALSPPPPSRPPADARPVPNASAMHAKLIKADFQGAIITGAFLPNFQPQTSPAHSDAIRDAVRQSKNPCLVGLSGIVVHETENAFKVVTERDHLKRSCFSEIVAALCSHILRSNTETEFHLRIFCPPLRKDTSLVDEQPSVPQPTSEYRRRRRTDDVRRTPKPHRPRHPPR